jgi:ELWxxDGT repeat protein
VTTTTITYFSKFENGAEELWVSDGTVAGTHAVKAIGRTFFNPLTTALLDGRAFFAADDGIHGRELWVSDGTTAGTMLLDDIDPGAGPSLPGQLTDDDLTLFFVAEDATHGFELWKTDGTAAGTAMVKDIAQGGFSSSPDSLTIAVGGTVFFSANDFVHGTELWKSDGTAGGTVMVKDISPGATASNPQELVARAGVLYFVADDGVHGAELWTSDGTAAGTVMVKDIAPGREGSLLQNLTNINGTLFFAADNGVDGTQLWKSDGTTAGTVQVKVIAPGGFASTPQNLTNVGGTLFFTANDIVHGIELWKSDGTTAGTVMIKDINPGLNTSDPENFTVVNGRLFFTANDDVHGVELWKSDGTAAGTVMVADLNPGAGGSNPTHLIDAEGVLQFEANDGTTEALFQSDGTAAGTIELARGVDPNTPLGVGVPPIVISIQKPAPVPNDLNGDLLSDVVWRSAGGALADWTVNGGAISSGALITMNGSVVAPAASWSIAGTSDFNGDGNADLLWRNTDGSLAEWTMNGSVIASSAAPTSGGVAARPDASWSIAGVGDFDGDFNSDVLWRNASGEVAEWQMNGATIMGSGDVTAGGVAVRPDASWKVAGIGDFNDDGMADILWRNSSGEVSAWLMNGTSIAGGGDLMSGGVAARPDASWSIAGIGDFNQDGKADVLWRNTNGSLAIWLMNGTTITSSGSITANGAAVTPDASWHIVEIGDFNRDGHSDILWRNDNGAVSEWLMNGTAISQAVTPTAGGVSVSPDASWATQAKPTIFA